MLIFVSNKSFLMLYINELHENETYQAFLQQFFPTVLQSIEPWQYITYKTKKLLQEIKLSSSLKELGPKKTYPNYLIVVSPEELNQICLKITLFLGKKAYFCQILQGAASHYWMLISSKLFRESKDTMWNCDK